MCSRLLTCALGAAWFFLHCTVTWPRFVVINSLTLLWHDRLEPEEVEPRHNETTDLQVIVASPGTSGTRSLYMALHRLGFNTWKHEELGHYLPFLVRPNVTPAEWVGPIRATGVQALVLEPWLDLVPKLLEISPKAKVILTMRDFEKWEKSRKNEARYYFDLWGWKMSPFNIVRALCHHLPVAPFWQHPVDRHHSFLRNSFTSALKRDCTAFVLPQRMDASRHANDDVFLPGNRTGMLGNKSNYEWYRSYIREIVPPGRLLEFEHGMGWEPFAAFLGRPVPKGWRGRSFPRTLAGKSFAETANLQEDPFWYGLFYLFSLGCLVCNFLLFRLCATGALALLRSCRRLLFRGGKASEEKKTA